MTARLLAVLVATASLASAVPALAAPQASDLEGTWRQRTTCHLQDDAVRFDHQLKIYRDQRGLRFVARAPLAFVAVAEKDPIFAGVYYGEAELNGDVLTLRVSERYKRDYQQQSQMRHGQLVARDVSYRLTPAGELIALDDGVCDATPFKRDRG